MMEPGNRHTARTAWFSAMTAAAVYVGGMIFELVGGRQLPGIPNWPAGVAIAMSATIFVVLTLRRRRPDVHIASLCFVLNSLGAAFALFVRDPYYARFGNWMPFQANKLACIIVALLAPELPSALIAIAIHVGSALLVLATVGPALRARIVFEPTGTLAFAFIGVVLALYRRRRLELEREVVSAHAEVLATERIARTILAVRDLANTPIQTVELCLEVLRERPADPDVLARLRRAVDRLHSVSERLQEYSAHVKWHESDLSLDALSELEKAARRPSRLSS